jgi:HlyD family secretion protein
VKWKRWLGILTVAALVVLALVYGFRPQPAMVEAAEVKRAPMRVTVEEEGKTRLSDRYVVSAPVAGVVQRVEWKVGDSVRAGQPLFRIEPLRAAALDPRTRAEAEARVDVAQAALRLAEQRLEAAKIDASYWQTELARVRKLHSTGDVAKERLDRTLTEAERADASLRTAMRNIEVARSELAAARTTVQHSSASLSANGAADEAVVVRAPVGGRVMRLVQESESAVQPGAPIVEIGNTRSLEAEVEVLSADAVKIAPGMRVLFERWGGDKPLEGRVRRIEPTAFTKISALGVEEQRVLVIVDISSPAEQWQRLGSGYRVEAVFVLWESDQVLQVPASALFRYEQGWAVFAVDQGLARRRVVQVGRRNGPSAEVLAGLSEGDRVIVHPDETVQDGKPVEVR